MINAGKVTLTSMAILFCTRSNFDHNLSTTFYIVLLCSALVTVIVASLWFRSKAATVQYNHITLWSVQ